MCAIKAPGFGENRKSGLQDLAVLTGGQVSSLFVINLMLYSLPSLKPMNDMFSLYSAYY